MLAVQDLEFELPERLVATHPASPRDSARMMVIWRSEPGRVEHRRVSDLPEYLRSGDVMVVNATRVLPARLVGHREDTGGKVDGLFLGGASGSDLAAAVGGQRGEDAHGGDVWRVLLKGRRMREGVRVRLLGPDDAASAVSLVLVSHSGEEGEGTAWVARVEGLGEGETSLAALERLGRTPLPPYIRAARKRAGDLGDDRADRRDYQTVYAAETGAEEGQRAAGAGAVGAGPSALPGAAGSVAAPTAGLHFTSELLSKLAGLGVQRTEVTLHVGTGTFKPVETEFVEQHAMHSEWCRVNPGTARVLTAARALARVGAGEGARPRPRVLAVGTTSARTLESFTPEELAAGGGERWTNVLITPGHRWRNLDGLLTNFHLPRSTLLAMVGSLLDERSGGCSGAGVPRLLGHYREAVREGYRFFSFGDAMLVLP